MDDFYMFVNYLEIVNEFIWTTFMWNIYQQGLSVIWNIRLKNMTTTL